MTPDDPRHGTLNASKNLKCRCDKCNLASSRYEKRRRFLVAQGLNPSIPAHGFKRRVQALMAIGWTAREIAEQIGVAPGNLARKMGSNSTVLRATHVRMCEVYERLSMTIPADAATPLLRGQTRVHARTRGIARRAGYAPPLAWDDIDDLDEKPHRIRVRDSKTSKTDVDPVVVERVLAGDELRMTRDERREIVRRAKALGWSEELIHERTGIARASDAIRYADVTQEAS